MVFTFLWGPGTFGLRVSDFIRISHFELWRDCSSAHDVRCNRAFNQWPISLPGGTLSPTSLIFSAALAFGQWVRTWRKRQREKTRLLFVPASRRNDQGHWGQRPSQWLRILSSTELYLDRSKYGYRRNTEKEHSSIHFHRFLTIEAQDQREVRQNFSSEHAPYSSEPDDVWTFAKIGDKLIHLACLYT